jgi:hypothetical protein
MAFEMTGVSLGKSDAIKVESVGRGVVVVRSWNRGHHSDSFESIHAMTARIDFLSFGRYVLYSLRARRV